MPKQPLNIFLISFPTDELDPFRRSVMSLQTPATRVRDSLADSLMSLEIPSPLATTSVAGASPVPQHSPGADADLRARVAELQLENERLKNVIAAMRHDLENMQAQVSDSPGPSSAAVETELSELSRELTRQLEYIEVRSFLALLSTQIGENRSLIRTYCRVLPLLALRFFKGQLRIRRMRS